MKDPIKISCFRFISKAELAIEFITSSLRFLLISRNRKNLMSKYVNFFHQLQYYHKKIEKKHSHLYIQHVYQCLKDSLELNLFLGHFPEGENFDQFSGAFSKTDVSQ